MKNCSLLLSLIGLIITANSAFADEESTSSTALSTNASAATITDHSRPETSVSTLAVSDLKEYAAQPEVVQRLIDQGLVLTRLNLSYKYGSDDPKNGGMDCSGTIYYLLNQAGVKDAPRDAGEMYKWVWQQSHFEAVVSPNASTFELDRLKPGDLLFWTGTYHVDRDPPVTHVMIYLGTNLQNGRREMLGASEGRPFDGKPRYGVSVFDFKMPKPDSVSISESRFIGYGPIPGLQTLPDSSAKN
jgi:cell wall-associated NlpC family hydrolase